MYNRMELIKKLESVGGSVIREPEMSHQEFSVELNKLLRNKMESNKYNKYFSHNIPYNVLNTGWSALKNSPRIFNEKTRNTCKKLKNKNLFNNMKGAYSYISTLKNKENTHSKFGKIINELQKAVVPISDYYRNNTSDTNFRCKPVILTLMECYVPFLYVLDTVTILASTKWTEKLNIDHVMCGIKGYLGNNCTITLLCIIPHDVTLLFRPNGSPRVTIIEILMLLHIIDLKLRYTILTFNTFWILCVHNTNITAANITAANITAANTTPQYQGTTAY